MRIVGPSGIGKTRLVLAALSPGEEGSGFLSDIVLYVDESEAATAAINSTVQILADMKARTLVVVDRCPLESHETFVGMVSRSSSRLSLVTIDNEIPSGESFVLGTEEIFRVGFAPPGAALGSSCRGVWRWRATRVAGAGPACRGRAD